MIFVQEYKSRSNPKAHWALNERNVSAACNHCTAKDEVEAASAADTSRGCTQRVVLRAKTRPPSCTAVPPRTCVCRILSKYHRWNIMVVISDCHVVAGRRSEEAGWKEERGERGCLYKTFGLSSRPSTSSPTARGPSSVARRASNPRRRVSRPR